MEIGRRKRIVLFQKLPIGIWLLEKANLCSFHPNFSYKFFVYLLTFITYTTYHLARKPFSVVKAVLCPQCSVANLTNYSGPTGWAPFNEGKNALLGYVDYAWLFSYAIALYFSGIIADRVNLRYYLVIGMLGSVANLCLLGVAYFGDIHHIAYFIVIQIFGGMMQATGLPAVIAIIGNWFGKQRRGLLLGLWYAHTPLGNILGTIIPSFWAETGTPDTPWGWAFIVPALITFAVTTIIFLFLVIDPEHVGLKPPDHHWEEEKNNVPAQATGEHVSIMKDGQTTKKAQVSHSESYFGGDKKSSEKDYGGTSSSGSVTASHYPQQKKKAISFFRALLIPGVIEYSLSLFFDKLVSYTFLFWLPLYVKRSLNWDGQRADWLAAVFDAGGILGGILTGLLSDILHARAVSCTFTLLLAIPSLFLLRFVGGTHIALYTFFLILCGIFVDGTYAIITTAVSSDLGTHVSLKNDQTAKATVTAIIDGTGSLGAAFGPLIIGLLTDTSGWDSAFYVLMASCLLSALFLVRVIYKEVQPWLTKCRDFLCSPQSYAVLP
eukprot:Em0021g568a